MSSGPSLHAPDYYEILGLLARRSSQTLAKEDVKAAYRRALLIHHPDKTTKKTSAEPLAQRSANDGSSYSIDQIVAAYETLSDPHLRSAYNKQLDKTYDGKPSGLSKREGIHQGVETLDLDDLSFDEETSTWHHECRCGNRDGYVLSEAELEREAEQGEIYVGCRGCSLFIRVVFGVVEEEEEAVVENGCKPCGGRANGLR